MSRLANRVIEDVLHRKCESVPWGIWGRDQRRGVRTLIQRIISRVWRVTEGALKLVALLVLGVVIAQQFFTN